MKLREQKVEPIKEVPQAFVGEIFFLGAVG